MRQNDCSDGEKIIPLRKRIVAEFIGTFVLVFAAAGADVANTLGGNNMGKFAVAVAPGLALMVMIYAVDKISGAYFNPAVSIGFALTGHLRKRDLPFYILTQIISAIIASLVVSAAIGPFDTSRAGLTVPQTGWMASFTIEIIFTFILMFAAVSLKEDIGYKALGGIAIGSLIIALGILGANVSGASMNPARSLGPALVAADISDQWIYVVAPIIGTILAVFAFKLVRDEKVKKTK